MAIADQAFSRGSRTDSRPVLALIAITTALLFGSALSVGATLAPVAIAGVAMLGVAIVRPRMAIYVLLFAALFFDVQPATDYMRPGYYLFQSLSNVGINLTPIEVLLLCAFIGIMIRLLFDDTVHLRLGELFLPIAILMFFVAGGIALGVSRGADMSILRSETRGLFYIPAIYIVMTHTFTKREHFNQLFTVFIIAVNLMAIESLYRYMTAIRGSYTLSVAYDLAFAHEAALFCASAITMLLARVVWSRDVMHEWRSVLLMILPLAALLVMRRRAGMVALDASILLLCMVLLRDNVKLFLMVVPLAVLGFGALLALTWNQEGGLGQPARSVRQITGLETQSSRDQASDDYREREGENIKLNVRATPDIGLGFGRQYTFYLPLADLGFWPLYKYVPHNTIFWMWMKGGVLAFIAMLVLFGTAMFRSMQIMRSLSSDSLKPIAFTLGALVLMFAMYSYVDLGLVSPRALTIFGIALGGIGSLGYLTRGPAPAKSAPKTISWRA